jgi:hypothetical protein
MRSLSRLFVAVAVSPWTSATFADEPPGQAPRPAETAVGDSQPANSAGKPTQPGGGSSKDSPAGAAQENSPADQPEKSAADEVVRVFPLDGEEWMKDPFLVLDFEMEAVVEDFKDGKAKPPADATQPRIISRFDVIIEQLEKKAGGKAGGGGGPRPAESSTLAKGPGGMGELKTPKKTGKGYDDLTPKEREKILQSKTEGFPPGFEDVLADYYRRLAKAESVAPETEPVPSSKSPTDK